MNFKKTYFCVFYTSFCIFAAISAITSLVLYKGNISSIFIKDDQNIKKKYIFDLNDNLLCISSKESNDKSIFSDYPKHLINAFLAKEDTNFFKHRGISIFGIIRSIIFNIFSGKLAQGASTITQQMVKAKIGNFKKTFFRKIYELVISIIVESKYSKERIFQEYLHSLNFGSGIIGISNAANSFWGKHVCDLDLSESATLVGIIQRPESHSPMKNYSLCLKKRNGVLYRMLKENLITKKQFNIVIKKPLTLKPIKNTEKNQNIIVSIEAEIKDILKNNKAVNESIFVYSTIDEKIQKQACIEFCKVIEDLKTKVPNANGSAIVIDISTGEIKAIVNGLNLTTSPICRTKNSYWQASSIIKPLICYYAFINGDLPNTIYSDTPIEQELLEGYIKEWNPKNYIRKFSGDMSIERALLESNNIVPIRVLIKYGLEGFIDLLNKTNCFVKKKHYMSIALGCVESNTYSIATYIAMFANGGRWNKPYIIKKIKNSDGNIILKEIQESKQILQKNKTEEVKSILTRIGIRISKKLNIENPKDGVIAKTGTSNDARSCWFACADDRYAVAVYVGADSYDKMSDQHVTSFRYAAKIGMNVLNKI
jgi:membrane peptidoglycan carboxypeptidase